MCVDGFGKVFFFPSRIHQISPTGYAREFIDNIDNATLESHRYLKVAVMVAMPFIVLQ